ncbi:MAG: M81 family metallopeptidase, partial [Bacillota bacterium]
HETNTFSVIETDLAAFEQETLFPGLLTGQSIIDYYRGTNTCQGGFIEVAERTGMTLMPTIWTMALPSGYVTEEAYDYLLDQFMTRLKNMTRVDGVLLDLHGAMVAEHIEDCEGHLLRTIRDQVGDVPIISTLDLHANITEEMVETATILVGYDTYPHVDTGERGREAAELMARVLRGEIRPTMALGKPPLLPPLQSQFTGVEPMSILLDMAHEFERDPRVLTITVSAGFPFADIREAGMSFAVTTDDAPELAREYARELSDRAWEMREQFLVRPVPVDEAVEAGRTGPGPVVLADIGDNPGAGTSCDGTDLLAELLRREVGDAVVAIIADPEAVAACIEAGVGESVRVTAGGRTDDLHGEPVELTGHVRLISDGRFINKGPMFTGLHNSMGRTVVLRCGGVDVILAEKRMQPLDLEMLRSLGIEPADRQIIAVKSAVHYRAAFGPIARQILEVDTRGISSPRLERLPFEKVRRPMYPLDLQFPTQPDCS